MIRTVEAKTESSSIIFDLFKPEAKGFLVYKIDGLGPGDIDVNTSERPYDGEYYISTRKGKRVIKLYIKPIWMPTKSIERLRNELYRYFPFKKEVTLTITTDTRTGTITGYVSDISPEIFSSSEVITVDITCPEPYFSKLPATSVDFFTYESLSHFKLISPKTVSFDGDGITASFEIPDATYEPVDEPYDSYQQIFTPRDISEVRIDGAIIPENEFNYSTITRRVTFNNPPTSGSVIEIDILDPGNPASIMNYSNRKNINYTGEIDSGVLIRVIFFRKYNGSFWIGKSDDNQWVNVSLADEKLNALLSVVLRKDFPNVDFDPSVDYYIKPRDVVIINTNPGKKGIYLYREILGKEYYLSLANCVFDSTDRPFTWWSIGLGDNDITIGSTNDDILNYANFAIDYSDKYAGL